MPSTAIDALLNLKLMGNSSTKAQLEALSVYYGTIEAMLRGSVPDIDIVHITSAYTATNKNCLILADATSAQINVSLPAVQSLISITSGTTKILYIKKTDTSNNPVVITAAGSDTIEGNSSISLSTSLESVILVSDGITWYKLGSAASTNVVVPYMSGWNAGDAFSASGVTPGGTTLTVGALFRTTTGRQGPNRTICGTMNAAGTTGWALSVAQDSLQIQLIDNGGAYQSAGWFNAIVHGHWIFAVAQIDSRFADLGCSLKVNGPGTIADLYVAARGGAITAGTTALTIGGLEGGLANSASGIQIGGIGYTTRLVSDDEVFGMWEAATSTGIFPSLSAQGGAGWLGAWRFDGTAVLTVPAFEGTGTMQKTGDGSLVPGTHTTPIWY